LSKLNYMWLKISAYSDLSPTGVCSREPPGGFVRFAVSLMLPSEQ